MNQAANMLDDSSAQCYNEHGPLEVPFFSKEDPPDKPGGFFLFQAAQRTVPVFVQSDYCIIVALGVQYNHSKGTDSPTGQKGRTL